MMLQYTLARHHLIVLEWSKPAGLKVTYTCLSNPAKTQQLKHNKV